MQLCHIDTIPDGDSKELRAANHSLIAVRQQQQVYVYLNRCPHRGIPLEWQPDRFLDLERRFIQCSTHGALFRIDTGLCIQGPCNGQALTPLTTHLDAEGYLHLDSALPAN